MTKSGAVTAAASSERVIGNVVTSRATPREDLVIVMQLMFRSLPVTAVRGQAPLTESSGRPADHTVSQQQGMVKTSRPIPCRHAYATVSQQQEMVRILSPTSCRTTDDSISPTIDGKDFKTQILHIWKWYCTHDNFRWWRFWDLQTIQQSWQLKIEKTFRPTFCRPADETVTRQL